MSILWGGGWRKNNTKIFLRTVMHHLVDEALWSNSIARGRIKTEMKRKLGEDKRESRETNLEEASSESVGIKVKPNNERVMRSVAKATRTNAKTYNNTKHKRNESKPGDRLTGTAKRMGNSFARQKPGGKAYFRWGTSSGRSSDRLRKAKALAGARGYATRKPGPERTVAIMLQVAVAPLPTASTRPTIVP